MFEKIKQPNLPRVILQQIKENVYEGKLKKGDKLPSEREFANTLGVSRSTLREAIKSLEIVGFVESYQGAGNYLSKNLSHSFSEPLSIMFMLEGGTVSQIHEFRQAIEQVTVPHAATMIIPNQILDLEMLCEQMEKGRGDQVELADLDRQFHMYIAEITSNPLLITMMNAAEALIQTQIRDVRKLMMRDQSALRIINQQHRALLAALETRDSAQATQRIVEHLGFVRGFIDNLI
jgi:GntR family transcriptional repressor for pyruvate dehydrogenase complex